MADKPGDLTDAKGRDSLRHHRERFGSSPSGRPETFYLNRWIPSRPHIATPGDFVMAVLGAIILLAGIAAVVVARFLR